MGFSNPFRSVLSVDSGCRNPNRPAGSRRRNPRFAPEGLEIRLSPSDLGVTVTSEVQLADSEPTEPPPPPTEDGSTPDIPPTVPNDPNDPA